MDPVSRSLLDLLNVKFLHQGPQTYLYRGDCEDLGFKNLFGGQILGQSLNAAIQAAPEGFLPNSMHAYFLLPGHVNTHVDYKVEILRHGRSFASLRVDAIQDGKIILTQNTSFQRPEDGFEHQEPMPKVEGPEGIMSQLEISRKYAEMIPESVRDKFTRDKPIESRPIDPINVFMPDKRAPHKDIWFKPIDDWSQQSIALHYAVLAYSSDFHLVGTALQPHGVSFASKGMQVASLDHAIWFHHAPRLDDWLLYSMNSPAAAGGRGLNFGHIYHSDGQLLMSVAQEGLIRQRK
ncbi:acyl-CoA thioesterase domain-containing protein [Bermanella sp. R86510]|uniref:acyl-CoA thioesterase domain-containing protein n=1 Tax=unclassified Bermanella TaxID=2627862 RepID=UPI0037CA0906